MVEVTEFTDAWVEFGVIRKLWGYAAERAPSTHPVAGSPAPDALSALGNFDGISYAKGASVIRQLIAHIGDDAFLAGVVAAPPLARLRQRRPRASSSPRWSPPRAGRWRRGAPPGWRPPAPTGSPSRTASLTRTPPAAHPADRPHTLDVAAFADGRELARVDLVAQAERTPVPGLGSLPAGAIVVPNAGDLTWAEVSLDTATLAALPGRPGRRAGRPGARGGLGRPARCRLTAPRSTPGSRWRSSRPPGRTRSARCSRGPPWPPRRGWCRSSSRRPSRRLRSPGSPTQPSAGGRPPRSGAPTVTRSPVTAARVWAGTSSDTRPAAPLGRG